MSSKKGVRMSSQSGPPAPVTILILVSDIADVLSSWQRHDYDEATLKLKISELKAIILERCYLNNVIGTMQVERSLPFKLGPC